MGSIISHLADIINEYGSYENYLKENPPVTPKRMKTVFVKYKEEVSTPMQDYTLRKSKIVKVNDLTELNDMFEGIIKVKILEDGQTCHLIPTQREIPSVTSSNTSRPNSGKVRS